MKIPTFEELLKAGVHFGHLKRKWNPKMRPYIFMEKKGIHLIDLNKTQKELEKAAKVAKQMAKSGRKILFVATKNQASKIVQDAAKSVNMPYVTERWLGGMLTNFSTIRRSVKKMHNIDRMMKDGSLSNLTKKERLMLSRERAKLERVLGGIDNLNRIPQALFIVDTTFEHLALDEARKLGLKTIGMVDTNSDPRELDFPIPSNDDSSHSIKLITDTIVDAIKEGYEEREQMKRERAETAQA